MQILDILNKAVELGAADVFLVAGLPVTYKCDGRQLRGSDGFMKPADIMAVVDEIYAVSRRSRGFYFCFWHASC